MACVEKVQQVSKCRRMSLPDRVAKAGGVAEWNSSGGENGQLMEMISRMCTADTVKTALQEVKAIMSLGHNLWAYAYMRKLYDRNMDLYYGTLLADPKLLMPVVYTPTVGEACQKFGRMPFYNRGCYVSVSHRGNIRKVLEEYAEAELEKDESGKYLCDCIVFSDGGRILGLGDLGSWGMGIPIGKLDLYTVCAGVNPKRTMPVIIDAGCVDRSGNTDNVEVRDHELYTGLKKEREMQKSDAGTSVNSVYYGEGNMIEEFMSAARDVFGKGCLLQFEDFNSNDAFPLLASYKEKYLTYNDDIQGTAAVTVAGILGAVKLRNPECVDLMTELRKEVFLFHGAGSANIGALRLLANEAGVPRSQLFVTNSRGIIWRSEDGTDGSFRNDEQKEFAQVGKPSFDGKDLLAAISNIKPTSLVGAVGRDPGCFNKAVVDAMLEVGGEGSRPGIFALSNPKTQAEVTSTDCWTWSNGRAIYGSGTAMESATVCGKRFDAGQVNNVYVFPGVSMGAVSCQASAVPERMFLAAAAAVANSLDAEDIAADRVVPRIERIREVGLNVATAVVLEAQELGIAGRCLGGDTSTVRAALSEMMWSPEA